MHDKRVTEQPFQPPQPPQQPPTAANPYQQPQQLPPPGFLKLNLQGNRFLGLITPTIKIDGYPVPAKYGENVFPVHPGQHLATGSAQWMWEYGQAQHPFVVGPGQTAELWYAAPLLTFMKGNMGTTKQKMGGMLGFVAFIVLMVLMLALVIGVAIVG